MAHKPDMTQNDMLAGLLAALAANTRREGWMLYSPPAHAAAAAVFDYLKCQDQFDLRFRIILHKIYSDSPVWLDMLAWGVGLHFVQWLPGGDCTIVWPSSYLDQLLATDSVPGDRELWLECARIFERVYDGEDNEPRT